MNFKKAIKKLVCVAAAILVAATGMSVTADNGSSRDYAGYGAVIYSDIGAYVNHYPIASYSCGGKTVVVAEDLRNFGFDVDWNGDARTLNILPNYTKEISGCGTVYSGAGRQGNVFTYTCDSDIKVYIGGIEISAYCIDGYMMVSLEDLAVLSEGIEFTWDPSTRSAKLWISWCAITVWQPLPVDVTVNNYPTAEIGYEYCCMGRVVGKGTLKEYSAGDISYDELVSISEEYNSYNNVQTYDGLTAQKALDLIAAAYGHYATGTVYIYYDHIDAFDSNAGTDGYQYFRIIYREDGVPLDSVNNVPCYEILASTDENFSDENTIGKFLDLNNNIIGTL